MALAGAVAFAVGIGVGVAASRSAPFLGLAYAAERNGAGEASVRFVSLNDQRTYRDFVVGPGKYEVFLKPGETRTFTLTVANRMGDDRPFFLSVEDVKGDPTGKEPVVLLGNDRGPYSLRDWVKPAVWKLTIPHGKKAIIPVRIAVPSDAEPGGYYGSLLVSTQSKDAAAQTEAIAGAAKVVARIGVLLFVRVPGEVREEGSLVAFSLKEGRKVWRHSDPMTFLISFRNDGTVHLNPSATITIRNLLGRRVNEIVVPAWYVLPQSLRTREVAWEVPYWLGRYTATLTLNPGYEKGAIQTATVTFWVVSWQALAVLAGVLLISFLLFVFLPKRYAIVRK